MTTLPAIADAPRSFSPSEQAYLNQIKQVLENISTSAEITLTDEQITDLVALGAKGDTGETGAPGQGQQATSVNPVALTGLTAIQSRTFTLLTWDAIPVINDSQHTIIYRSFTDNPLDSAIVGTSKTLVYSDYTPSDNTYYYWIASQSRGSIATPDGIEGVKNTDNPVISTAIDSKINTVNVVDYIQAGAIGTDFLFAANLAALTANLGDVTAGTLSSASGTFLIDLINSYIEIAGAAGRNADDYIRIENGRIQQWIWTGLTHQQAQSLNVIETGLATDGATVTLQKYYVSQPKIIVTPYETPVYDTANSAQDQILQIRAENINNIGGGIWQFDAISRLILGAGSETQNKEHETGPLTGDVISINYITPLNTTDVAISIDLTSIRGTGVAPDYFHRTVTWTVYYRLEASSGFYTPISAGTVPIGATLNPINNTYNLTFPSSDEWEFYITAVYSDAGGTFADPSGSGGFDYLEHTRTATDVYDIIDVSGFGIEGSDAKSLDPTIAAFTPTVDYSVYEVQYTWDYGYYYFIHAGASVGEITASVIMTATSRSSINTFVPHSGTLTKTSGSAGANQGISESGSGVSFDQNYVSGDISGIWDGIGAFQAYDTTVTIEQRFTNIEALIKERKPITNSTTAQNTLKVNNFVYTLAGSSVLGTGTLSWQAIL